jgi:hypothetical protein
VTPADASACADRLYPLPSMLPGPVLASSVIPVLSKAAGTEEYATLAVTVARVLSVDARIIAPSWGIRSGGNFSEAGSRRYAGLEAADTGVPGAAGQGGTGHCSAVSSRGGDE